MSAGMNHFGRVALVVAAVVLLSDVRPAGQGQAQGQGQGRGRGGRSETPPMAGALRGEEAARAIRGRAARGDRDTGTPADPESLIRLLETDETAWVTPEGHVMFVDAMAQDGAAAGDLAVPLAAPPVPLGLTDAGLPIHHSKPGARFKFYLDFDGDFVDGRSTWGFSRNLPGYSIDNNPFHFNQEEQGVISRIWGRVAEDYAAFDIDVTTERPAELSFGNPDQRNVLWSIFTRAQSANFNFFV